MELRDHPHLALLIIIKVLKSYKKLASPQSNRLIASCISDTSTGMTSRILRLNSSKANSWFPWPNPFLPHGVFPISADDASVQLGQKQELSLTAIISSTHPIANPPACSSGPISKICLKSNSPSPLLWPYSRLHCLCPRVRNRPWPHKFPYLLSRHLTAATGASWSIKQIISMPKILKQLLLRVSIKSRFLPWPPRLSLTRPPPTWMTSSPSALPHQAHPLDPPQALALAVPSAWHTIYPGF